MSTAKDMREHVSDPAQLAREIRRALDAYGRGDDNRLLPVIDFFEGELKLIEYALRALAGRRHGRHNV
jgi:hypothetical protein